MTLSSEIAEAVTELTRLAEERPALGDTARFLAKALPKLYETPSQDFWPSLTLPARTEHVRSKLLSGIPLLRGEAVRLDGPAFERRWESLCSAASECHGGTHATEVADALKSGKLSPDELLQEILAGRPETVHARADALGLDAGLTATILRLTLFPVLTRVQAELGPLPSNVTWERGYCYVCGSWPLLGEYRGLEQTRLLRCGLCAAEWEVPRLFCPFCGTRDYQVLGYFHVEGEEGKYRAATCDSCRGYVKMVSTLASLSALRLLVADLATMHLDLAAAERGYVIPEIKV